MFIKYKINSAPLSKILLLTAFVCFCICPIYAQLNAGNLITKDTHYEIPLHHIEKEILLTAKLKGEEFTFLLDTGAPFFISDAIQKKFNFPVIYEVKLNDASGKEDKTVIVQIDTVSIGPFVFTNTWAVVLNMNNEAHQCHEFAGNFGSNLLQFLIVQFDLQKGKVLLSDNEKFIEKNTAPFSPAALSGQSDFTFPVRVSRNIADTILFDSGDGALYEITDEALQKIINKNANEIIRKGRGVTSMGSLGIPESTDQYTVKTQISFGNTTVNDGIANNTGAGQSRLGRYLLHYGALTLNYINKQYSFKQYVNPALPEKQDFGFQIITNGKKIIAGTVWEESEAEKAGMKSGDEIISVDEVMFAELPLCDIEPAYKRVSERKEIKIQFINNITGTKTITLAKQDIRKL